MINRFELIFAGLVAAAFAAGCATSSTPGTGDDAGKQATGSATSETDRAIGMKRTIDDPYAIRDMVRPPGTQTGRKM